MTDRGKLLLGSGAVLWVLARSFGAPELHVAALACATLVLAGLAFAWLTSARLTVRRRVQPNRLFFDAESRVELDLRNAGRMPTALMLVEDTLPAALGTTPRFALTPLRGGEVGRVSYRVHGRHRGRFPIGPARVVLRDPFGVAARRGTFGTAEEIVVYPPVWALPPTLPQGGRQSNASEGPTRPLAPSGEFANVREYVRGDDLRKVHWKSTAHRGKLMLKQEEAPQRTDATLVLDVRRDAHHGSGPTSSFERAVATVASAAYHLADRGYALRLVTSPVATPPPKLPWHLVLERLAVIDRVPGNSLGPLWRQLAKGAVGEGLLLAVVAVPDAADLIDMVAAGRAFGSRVAVIVDASTSRARSAAQQSLIDRAVAALREAGWRVTVFGGGERLAERWEELALRPGRAAAAVDLHLARGAR